MQIFDPYDDYLVAGSSTAYMNGTTANLSGIAGAANNANFGIRLVSAATGADDTNVAGAALNNTSGSLIILRPIVLATRIGSADHPSARARLSVILRSQPVCGDHYPSKFASRADFCGVRRPLHESVTDSSQRPHCGGRAGSA